MYFWHTDDQVIEKEQVIQTNGVSDGEAGMLIKSPEGHTTTAGIPTGKHCSNYAAKVQSLNASSLHDWRLAQSDSTQVVFPSDALVSWRPLQETNFISLKIPGIAKNKQVVLQGVSAHCGLPGNETANQLSKTRARGQQPDNKFSFTEKKACEGLDATTTHKGCLPLPGKTATGG